MRCEDDPIRVAGHVRVGCVEIHVDPVRNDSHVEGRIDLAKGVPVGIADNDDPIEATVFRCDEAPYAVRLASQQPTTQASCRECPRVHIQVPCVERDENRGLVGESSSERREPAGTHVDDIGNKGVELIAERSAQRGGEAVGR
jgi:hypothetical protein